MMNRIAVVGDLLDYSVLAVQKARPFAEQATVLPSATCPASSHWVHGHGLPANWSACSSLLKLFPMACSGRGYLACLQVTFGVKSEVMM